MRSKLGNSLWGIFFLIIGLGFAGNAFGFWSFNLFFDGWWTLFIIVPCTISIIQNGISTGSIIGLIIGIMLLLSRQDILDASFVGRLFLPIIFIVIGLGILFRSIFYRPKNWNDLNIKFKDGGINYTAIFSSQKIRFPNVTFKGADACAIFGGVELDLRDAVIQEDTIIHYTAIFGGGDIIVPHNVNVKVSNVPIFGGVSNKALNPGDSAAPTIYINSTCIFGGVDIK